MKRTNQHFTKPQLEKLDHLQLLRDVPRAEIIRQAIDEYLAKPDVKKELETPLD